MSGIGPGNKYFQPSDDFSRKTGSSLQVQDVNVRTNMNDLQNRTSERIFQVAVEQAQSTELVVSSADRNSGTPFNFIADMGAPTARPRTIQVKKVIFPFIPNMNNNNNGVEIQLANAALFGTTTNISPATVQFKFERKHFDPDSFSNELQLLLTNALIQQLPGQPFDVNQFIFSVNALLVTCVMDLETHRFTLRINISDITVVDSTGTIFTPVVGANLLNFWFVTESSFIQRGRNFVPFPSENRVILTPSNPTYSQPRTASSVLESFISSLVYTRYILVNSTELTLYGIGASRINVLGLGGGEGRIVCTIDTSDFAVSTSSQFAGAIKSAQLLQAPIISAVNPQQQLSRFIDFEIKDEFGDSIDKVFNEDGGGQEDIGATLNIFITH